MQYVTCACLTCKDMQFFSAYGVMCVVNYLGGYALLTLATYLAVPLLAVPLLAVPAAVPAAPQQFCQLLAPRNRFTVGLWSYFMEMYF